MMIQGFVLKMKLNIIFLKCSRKPILKRQQACTIKNAFLILIYNLQIDDDNEICNQKTLKLIQIIMYSSNTVVYQLFESLSYLFIYVQLIFNHQINNSINKLSALQIILKGFRILIVQIKLVLEYYHQYSIGDKYSNVVLVFHFVLRKYLLMSWDYFVL
ncbi:unnamed protein product [Paramecium primaurelia]|uniref:Uncharacterized protein n=1 Tax=Paramecium primaurelia TaxID=5886 RepID=A0A8S1P2F1_PARPR|nr:unnamed protein product [Paramecium primaurelia]